jgi:uncharacterized membrane protein YfcA
MEFWIGFILLGLVVGAYGTMIGAGGGFVLVPILLLLYRGDPPATITAISLAVVFANALSGTFAYARMKRIHYRAGIMFALATIPGAIFGAKIVDYIPRHIFGIVMSLFLLGIGALLVFRPRESKRSGAGNGEPLVETERPDFPFNRTLGISLSAAVGVVASMLGVGGGIIHVPALTGLLNFPVHVATATSHFVLVFTALAGTMTHLLDGTLQCSDLLHRVLPLAIGVVPGAQLGAMLSRRVKGLWILRALGIALVAVAARLLLS